VRSKNLLTNHDFLTRVREYLQMDACVWETDENGAPLGDGTLPDLQENAFYIFDGEALRAVSCAIEDIALEEANGSLLASIEEAGNIDNERYDQLAATIDDVQVIASGKLPRRPRLKFCPATDALKNFWAVVYDSGRIRAMVLAQQINDAPAFEQRRFRGFYTFNAGVVARVRQEFADLLGGKCPSLKEFSRLQAIDSAGKLLNAEFSRQRDALQEALRKLQSSDEDYRPRHFVADLDRALSQLQQWKVRLPELLVAER
jgi:hypothetical protein